MLLKKIKIWRSCIIVEIQKRMKKTFKYSYSRILWLRSQCISSNIVDETSYFYLQNWSCFEPTSKHTQRTSAHEKNKLKRHDWNFYNPCTKLTESWKQQNPNYTVSARTETLKKLNTNLKKKHLDFAGLLFRQKKTLFCYNYFLFMARNRHVFLSRLPETKLLKRLITNLKKKQYWLCSNKIILVYTH